MSWLRFNAWPISFHITVWSLVSVLVCIAALASGRAAYDRVQATSALTTNSRITLGAASELLQAVVDLETGLRGYALTKDPAFLEPYETGQPHVVEQIQRLRALVQDRPEQLTRINRAAFLVEDWIQAFARPVIAGAGSGQDLRPIFQSGAGKRRIDAIRHELAAFEATETRALAGREAEDAAAWRLAGILAVWTMLSLLASAAIALLVGRRIAGSLDVFARAAGEIAGGKLETRLSDEGRSELAVTGRAINRMAAALSEAREELLAQNDALVEQVREAERARGELRAILDATSDAIILVSPDGIFKSINRRTGDLLGVDPRALVGRRFGESAAFFNKIFEDAERLRARLDGTAAEPTTELVDSVQQRWPEARNLALFSPPVHSESGEHLGRLYVFRDITHEVELEEQRRALEAERSRAAEVQADLLPRAAPDLPGIELAGRCIPALQVGGDFFDWYTAAGLVWLTLGDVMGKGMPAALLMATVRATLRAGIHGRSPAAALNLAQAVLGEDLGYRDSYVTLLHAVYEPATGRLTYVDAGHGHALIRRADGTVEKLTQRSFPLGMPFAMPFEEGQVMLAPGDALILYSDGLVDAVPDVDIATVAGRVEGVETADETVRRLIELAVGSSWPASAMLVDDLTVVVLKAVEVSVEVSNPGDLHDGHGLVSPGVESRPTW
jgi:PAS domain S-box-containing protein